LQPFCSVNTYTCSVPACGMSVIFSIHKVLQQDGHHQQSITTSCCDFEQVLSQLSPELLLHPSASVCSQSVSSDCEQTEPFCKIVSCSVCFLFSKTFSVVYILLNMCAPYHDGRCQLLQQ
jgi:hypothetical protein